MGWVVSGFHLGCFMNYDIYPVRANYEGLGEVEYDGFSLEIKDDYYLLDWNNTSVWEFGDDCYDHIQIATDSLKRIVSAGSDLVPYHELDDGCFILFLEENEDHQDLAEDLIDGDFPRYYQPFPDPGTLEIYTQKEAGLGQAAFELWLKHDDG